MRELKVSLPTSINDVPLKRFLKYKSFVSGYDLENGDPIFFKQKVVQYLCDIPLAVVSRTAKKDFDALVSRLDKIMSEEIKFSPTFELDGKKFGFIPDLDNDMSIGEYADFNSYVEDESEMHRLMSILYRPITIEKWEKYRIEEYEGTDKYCDVMLNMPTGIALGAMVFFCNLTKSLLKAIQEYLGQVIRENPEAALDLANDGVGISILLPSLETIISELTKRLESTFIRL